MASLNIRNVEKHYGDLRTLKNVNIDIEDGDFLVLLGPSGCGKSTLLSAIAGLAPVTSGEIVIDGVVVNDMESADRDIAMVFQSYALYPTMTVRRNLTFGMRVRGASRQEQDEAVKRVAAVLQLGELLDRKPSQLSGGQRQRVAMGRAMVRQPKIFLFDEPLSNLDAKLRTDMRAEIKKLHQREKTTTVYVTHDQIEAMTLATKIVVMKGGEVQQIGSPQEIYEHPNNLFIARFIGSPAMNCINGTLDVEGSAVFFQGASRNQAGLRIHLGPLTERYNAYRGGNVVLGIRPEWLAYAEPGSAPQLIDAVVDVVEPTGSDNFVLLEASGETLMARFAPGVGVSGQRVGLTVDMDKTLLFDAVTEQRISR
ncbi:sn-glycerol-3-phosphate ABC transporter ATP-binding protein UgpC [Pseudomonas sp. CCC3.1]|uniref:ABC transporter ATP-binding protein n=1 Tax=Pseudomonas sp. CCC3.1 TaxID=3048607 RepID=UPI002AC8EC62|nr:sn-glycerol-3-phosphate ABC transporter ATP-binding protein UgpC [Pseudomonas sp. CCC3.1]MEB0206567.1 sn-glycerol-3-phosphate ABC transporter ATP-binding protein UgpC [Pseudomonas sp. CCC3.1]WPX38986.1 sn-glycerol-3-phosphate ABC transporter ATP-binding protein UgpC [Pseudomonas sp. CCC3.1]